MVYRTYFDINTGSYLGAYQGPEQDNPHLGHPSVPGDLDSFHKLNQGGILAALPRPDPEPTLNEILDALLEQVPAPPGSLLEGVKQRRRS